LQYLRQDCALPGTKEGCAEGDCGACTVTVSDVDARGRVRHRAVNACIQFLPVVHGRAVTTVEGIAMPEGPHPVQRAMVDQHASQCGFCTPGFVMSLYAGYREASPCMVSRGEIDRMLSGNLCRCTGYRPIAAAAVQAFATPRGAAETARDAALARDLAALRRASGELVLDGAGGKWYSPATEEALARCLAAHPDARLIAGLTDVGLWSTKQLRSFDKLVYLGNIASLKQVKSGGGVLSIGAGVTWSDAIPVLSRHWPQMDGFLARFASPPVRNTATVGGNVANGSPIGDSMPAFIALGARVVLRGAKGEREMPLEDFYLAYQKTALAPGEYVAGLRIPLPAARHRFRVYKLSKRFDQDISAVCAAFAVDIERGVVRAARIAMGGMAATPKRAPAAEAALVGTTLDDAALAAAQAALELEYTPIADMRASAAYRQATAKNLLRRFVLELRQGAAPVSLDQLKVIA
jgi:xanthine dehydrogenase small subunit